MSANQFQVMLPNEFMPFLLKLKDGNTPDEKVTLSLALGMFLSNQVTLAKAAELANRSIWEFVDILKSLDKSWGEYSDDAYMMDELTLSGLTGAK